MIDLSTRSYELELMDDFSSEGEVIDQTLKELENVNVYLGGNGLSIEALKKIIFENHLKECTIADLGCGGGYTMMHMADWAKKSGVKVQLTGVDANPNIIAFAEKNTALYENISYQSKDIFSAYFQNQQFDIIHCSLFTHHFTDEELIALFKTWSKQANTAVIINDLHRHTISYYFTKWIIRALSKSEMVRYDSVLSVKRAFKRKELIDILNRAGITNYSLKWKWAFRWELIIKCNL
jgi:2-polyprenyl-3-methyl-5-hydroxy-6-metoxy-1,4-benzoquinol methylase